MHAVLSASEECLVLGQLLLKIRFTALCESFTGLIQLVTHALVREWCVL
jgi:hypothetical protein